MNGPTPVCAGCGEPTTPTMPVCNACMLVAAGADMPAPLAERCHYCFAAHHDKLNRRPERFTLDKFGQHHNAGGGYVGRCTAEGS